MNLDKIHEEVFNLLKENLILTAYKGPKGREIKLRERHISTDAYKYVERLYQCYLANSISKAIFDITVKDIASEIIGDVKHNLYAIKQGQLSEAQKEELKAYLTALPIGALLINKKEALIKGKDAVFTSVEADEADNSAALYEWATPYVLTSDFGSINSLVKTEEEVEKLLKTLIKERKYVDRWINIIEFVNENRK